MTSGGEDKQGELSQEVYEQRNLQNQLGQIELESNPDIQTQTDEVEPSTSTGSTVNKNIDVPKHTKQNKKKETCQFYTRGHCNRNNECRFGHPDICKKFRQFGSKSTDHKGCDGKSNAFHPNACRSSLLSKTCSFKECRFFHLRGTKTSNFSHTDNNGPDWRSSKQWIDQLRGGSKSSQPHRNTQPNQLRPRQESKNWQHHSPDPSSNPQTGNASKEDPVKRNEEQIQLAQTLEAIMKRLAAMEARQTVYIHPAMNLHPPTQPILSPVVPLPSTQTQHQWASPNQWTQSQF